MGKFNESLSTIFLTFFLVFFSATIGGTIFYLTFPSLHELFPSAVSNGILPATLEWWTSVKIVWLVSILFKSAPSRAVPAKTNTVVIPQKDKNLN